jgi:phage/plasmid-like protein (TIGR03299 family)
MAHELEGYDQERLLLHTNPAWHGLGRIITDDLTAVQAARASGLIDPIEQWKLQANGPNGEILEIDSHVANVMLAQVNGQDFKSCLGVVGSDYQVFQNLELAEFVDALADTGQVVIESCGSIRNGKRVWFLARGDAFDIGGGDTVYPYIMASNGHDGYQTARITPTTIRTVCSNTFHMVVPRTEGERAETAAISIRHTGNLKSKVEAAKASLKHYASVLARNQELFQMMQEKKTDRDLAKQLFADSYSLFWPAATGEELASKDIKVRGKAECRMARMHECSKAFLARYDDEKAKFGMGDNLWLAVNAMTGYIQHDRGVGNKNDDVETLWRKRAEQNLFSENSKRTLEVFNHAMALAM